MVVKRWLTYRSPGDAKILLGWEQKLTWINGVITSNRTTGISFLKTMYFGIFEPQLGSL